LCVSQFIGLAKIVLYIQQGDDDDDADNANNDSQDETKSQLLALLVYNIG
jgi:hypothetical protein